MRKVFFGLALALVLMAVFSALALPDLLGQSEEAPLEDPEIARARQLNASLSEGIEWFLRNENSDFIHYSYDPAKGRYSADDNTVRKLATLWAISKSYRETGDTRLKALFEKGYAFFKKDIIYLPSQNISYMPIPEGKIAHSAFMILALIEADDFPERNMTLALLGAGLLERQREDGAFRTFFEENGVERGIDYYPGEAMLSLVSLYEETGEEKYLDSVRRGFYYYRDYWREKRTMPFTPWHIQAYYLLHRNEQLPEYREFVFEMGDYLSEIQENTTNGAFSVPGGISTAVYIEGMEDAYSLAVESADSSRALRYRRVLFSSIDFMRSLQYSEDERARRELPENVLGGFRSSFPSPVTRIDNNQHAVLAMLKHKKNFYSD